MKDVVLCLGHMCNVNPQNLTSSQNRSVVAFVFSFLGILLDTWTPSNMQTLEGSFQSRKSYLSKVVRL